MSPATCEQTLTSEEPTWESVSVARCPQSGFRKCCLNKGRCGCRMLGFLDAGSLRFPVLVSQRQSNGENLTGEEEGSRGTKREGVENLLGTDDVT